MLTDFKVREGETKEEFRNRVFRELKEAETKRKELLRSGDLRVVMDVDDYGFLLPGHDDLLRLKSALPNFRITCFTIPLDKAFFFNQNAKHFTWKKYEKWAAIVNEHDWIEIALHGFSHIHQEMEIGYDKTLELLQAVENIFERVGLKYQKIFKAPYWQYSYDALMALKDKGYTVAIDRNYQRPVPKDLPTYIYNWSFEEVPPDVSILKGHGHFTGANKNNIGPCLPNILHHLPRETKFLTISEYLKEQHGKDN